MELKFKDIHYYYDNRKNVNQVSNKFKADRKQLRNCVKSEVLIQKKVQLQWTPSIKSGSCRLRFS